LSVHLYLHIPFCARRCSYCDFAIAVRREVPARRFTEDLLAEWKLVQADPSWAASPGVETVYFGGGTPSLLEPAELGRIMAAIGRNKALVPGAEVTLEANPDDVTPARARAWRELGINRVSLGLQSFEPRVLEWMHRTHRAEQNAAAVASLRDAGIENISLDLIFALPAELERDWSRDLDRALALEPSHLSLYGLTVEPHTPLARWVERGEILTGSDDRYADEFLLADTRLTRAGYEHYEVSNYGLPGQRARHNSAYWRRAPFLGLGPSAHSGWDRTRRWNRREFAAWSEALEQGQVVVAGQETLDDDAEHLEQLYLGLRTSDGVPSSWIPPADRATWLAAGWVRPERPDRVVLTPDGWLRLDSLVGHLQLRTTTP
jgi:oxygen-independent coproporphyrinogen-3 oxidase